MNKEKSKPTNEYKKEAKSIYNRFLRITGNPGLAKACAIASAKAIEREVSTINEETEEHANYSFSPAVRFWKMVIEELKSQQNEQ